MKKNFIYFFIFIQYFVLPSAIQSMSSPYVARTKDRYQLLADARTAIRTDTTVRHDLISGLETFSDDPTIGGRLAIGVIAFNEKFAFDQVIRKYVIKNIVTTSISTLGGINAINTGTEIVPRTQVPILVGSIRHLVMTHASAYTMDGKQAKNTTLASLGAGVLAALQVAHGPLNPTGTAILTVGIDRRAALANFIRKTASYIELTIRSHTDRTMDLFIPRIIRNTGTTFVEESSHTHTEVIAFCTKINTMLHPNDSDAFFRKEKRRYYQVPENLHWVLLWLLLEEYYNSGALLPTITEHESGKESPATLAVLPSTAPLDGRAVHAMMLLLKGF